MNFDQTLDAISTILRNTDDLYAGQAHGHLDELQINHYNLINKHEALQADYDNLKSKHEQVLETNSKLASTIQEQHTLIDDLKHRVAVERDTSAKYARQLATAKEKITSCL
jgi:predicted nuclease with TOPRIM domain